MSAPSPAARHAVLWRESSQRADSFPAFDKKRGHRIPDAASPRATSFFRHLAEAEIAQEIETCYAALRAHLGYKRKQLQVILDPDAAAITTPDFEFHVVVMQDPADPRCACLRRTIQGVSRPELLAAPAFAEVFGGGFDGLDLGLDGRIDVSELIDRLEEQEPEGWRLDYGFEATELRLSHPKLPLDVHVTPVRVRLVGPRPQGATLLLEAADAALAAMGGQSALGALAG